MRMIQCEAEGHQPTKVLMCDGFESATADALMAELCFRDVGAAKSAIRAIGGRLFSSGWPHINAVADDDEDTDVGGYSEVQGRWVQREGILALQAAPRGGDYS